MAMVRATDRAGTGGGGGNPNPYETVVPYPTNPPTPTKPSVWIYATPSLLLSEVIRDLTGHLRFAGVKIQALYLDRGFACVDVIETLDQMRLPAVIACPLRGSPTSGVRAYCTGRASHLAHHTFRSAKHGRASVTLAVVRSGVGGRRTPKRVRWFVYILVGIQRKPLAVHGVYRYRFGVETSYRVLNQIRPRTTSRNPAVRLLLTTIGFLQANLWVALKRQVCRRILPPHGFRLLPVEHFDDQAFRLMRLKILLRHAIESRYGLRLSVPWSLVQP